VKGPVYGPDQSTEPLELINLRPFAAVRTAHVKRNGTMEHTYFELTFSKSEGGRTRKIRVSIELNSGDTDLLLGDVTEEKALAIARRTGILDFLPRGLNSDWPRSGKIINHSADGSWDNGIKPTNIHGHNVWIIEDA
jgi:hypothetical protein